MMRAPSFVLEASLFAFVLSSLAFVRTARADDAFRLRWSSPPVTPACPSTEKLAREVAAKLGRDPFDDTSNSEIRGSIEREGTSWVVKVGEYKDDKPVYTDESSPFDAPDCQDPHDFAVHQIAVFIQTGRFGAKPPPPPAPKPEPIPAKPEPIPAKPEPKPVPTAKPIPHVSIPPAPPFDSHIFLGSGTSIGLLPAPSPAISLSAGFGRGRWEVDARLLMLVAAEHDVEPFSLGMTGGLVGGCFRFVNQPRIAFLGCGHVIVSALHTFITSVTTEKAGATPIDAGNIPWFGLSISPRLRILLAKPLALQIGMDLVVPVIGADILDAPGPNERSVFTQTPIAVVPLAEIGVTIF